MAKTPHEIYLAVNGKTFDVDGYYGAQCWDGVMYINRTYWGGTVHHCGGDGYVHNLWTNRKSNGMLNDFIEVPIATAQDGDVFIWKWGAAECPVSHIAIFRKWSSGKSRAIFLGQNQGGRNGAFNQKDISVSGVLGVLRPKCYATAKPQPKPAGITWTPENGVATFIVDYVNIHKDSPDGPVIPGIQYNSGQSVQYFAKCAYKGHRWVKYHRAGGGIGCVAVSNSEKRGVEPWATFK